MKINLSILLTICLLNAACSSDKITRDQASEIVKSQNKYPNTFDHPIYTLSSEAVTELKNAGLDSSGYVQIIKETGATIGLPLVVFTAKSKPLLIPPSAKDKQEGVQRVKVADTDFEEISSVKQSEDGKHAKVEYTLTHKNISPFSVLVNRDFTKKDTRILYLVKDNGKWEVDSHQSWDL